MASGYSLHIGINKVDPGGYSGWEGPLQACEADANDMADIASDRGFKSQILLTKKATSENVLSSLNEIALAAVYGDIVFCSYSCHGAQIPD